MTTFNKNAIFMALLVLSISAPAGAENKLISHTSSYGTLLMTYGMCTCGDTRVWSEVKGNNGKPESQIWSIVPASSPGRYYIRAEVVTCFPPGPLYLTSPALSSDEYPSGVIQKPYLAPDDARQEWILETTQGYTTIYSASRVNSRDPYSVLAMSIDSLDDMFMTSEIEANQYRFLISSYTGEFRPSESCFPSPSPVPVPSPSPIPVPSPSPIPVPSPSPVPRPPPSGNSPGKKCTSVTTISNPPNTAYSRRNKSDPLPRVKKVINFNACKALCVFPNCTAYNYSTVKKTCYLFRQSTTKLKLIPKPKQSSARLVCKKWQ